MLAHFTIQAKQEVIMDYTYTVNVIEKSTGDIVKSSEVVGGSKAMRLARALKLKTDESKF